MDAVANTLKILKGLSERPMSADHLAELLMEEGFGRSSRTIRRYISALREAGFGIELQKDRYVLTEAPLRLPLSGHEALSALSVLESLAERDPAYGEHLASAAAKLRRALPEESRRFADSGRVEFDLEFASDPPENPEVLDTLRRAVYHNQKVRILYHSLSSDTTRNREIEPVRVYYAQRAHRLYAYERSVGEYREFRVNRIQNASMLPDKFSPEAHIERLKPARVRLNRKTFMAYGRAVIQDPHATVSPLPDGGAIVEGRVASTFWTVRDLASLGPEAEVLGGEELRSEFLRFLHGTLDKYS